MKAEQVKDCLLKAVEEWQVRRIRKEECDRTISAIHESTFKAIADHWHYQTLDSISFLAKSLDLLEYIEPTLQSTWLKDKWGKVFVQIMAKAYRMEETTAYFALFEDSDEDYNSYATSRALKFLRRVIQKAGGGKQIRSEDLRNRIQILLGEGAAEKIRILARDCLKKDLLSRNGASATTIEKLYRYYDILLVLGFLKEEEELCKELFAKIEAHRSMGGYWNDLNDRRPLVCSTHFALSMLESILYLWPHLEREAKFPIRERLEESAEFLKKNYIYISGVGGGFAANKTNNTEKPNLLHTWLALRTLEVIYSEHLNEKKVFYKRLKDEWANGIVELLANSYTGKKGRSGFSIAPNSVPSLYGTECGLSLVRSLISKEVGMSPRKNFPWISFRNLYQTLIEKPDLCTGQVTGWIG